MKLETVALGSISPDPANTRKHSRRNLDAIKASLRRFGQQKPIVVDSRGTVLAGNGTLAAATELGWSEIQIVRTALAGVDATAFGIADNRTAELAEWDENLGDVLASLKAEDFPLAEIGFDEADLAELAGEPEPSDADAEPQIDKAEELRVKWGVELGQLWQLGEHRIACGDSTDQGLIDRILTGVRADMCFTDPPYGVDYSGGIQFGKDGVKKDQRQRLLHDHDPSIYSKSIPIIAKNTDGPIYTFFAGTKAKEIYEAIELEKAEIHAMIVWVKNGGYGALNACYKQKHEPCLFWKPKGSNLRWTGDTRENTVWEIEKDGRNQFHPTQKPVDVATRAISNHNAITVFEPFSGSGTTIIACERTGRKCRAIELNPGYVAVAIQRWADATGKEPRKL